MPQAKSSRSRSAHSTARKKAATKKPATSAKAKTKPKKIPNEPANEAVRERIVVVALKIFARSGFDGTAITQIAREVGIASPLIYYYFKDKEELWKAAVDSGLVHWTRNIDSIQKELRDADLVTILKVQLRRFLYFSANHREVSSLILNAAQSDPQRLKWLIENHLGAIHINSNAVIESALEQGLIKKFNPGFFNQFIIGGIVHFLNSSSMLAATYDLDPLDEETVDEFADFVVDIIFNGALITSTPSQKTL